MDNEALRKRSNDDPKSPKTSSARLKVELQKGPWPWDPKEKGFRRYKELMDSTIVVLIAMLLLGGYIAFFDFILVNIVGFLTRS